MNADEKEVLSYETGATAREGNTGFLDRLDWWLTGGVVFIVISVAMASLIVGWQ